MRDSLRIGNGAGFWGDNLDAPLRLARSGNLDFLTLEYLAELTMSILAHLRSKNPNAGYVYDFPDLIDKMCPLFREHSGLSVVTNAGGLNPRACAFATAEHLVRSGQGDERIGVVLGDDVLNQVPEWVQSGLVLDHLETGEPISQIQERLVSANVYLGADRVASAIDENSRIVIAGRCADASLTLGPVVSCFKWPWNDWDRLAQASVAGHLIECGAQVTGGLLEDWDQVENLAEVGYPIAEIDRTGKVTITKAAGTGGCVSIPSVSEQLVYEIDDPTCYRTPDVNVDLSGTHLSKIGSNRVMVRGAKGQAPSEFYKLAAIYRDGWTASGMMAVVGRDAESKARFAGKLVLDRVRLAGFELADSLVECLGAGDVVRGVLKPQTPPVEVVLRVTVRDPRRAAVERFCRELAPLITSGPPGFAGYASGRPEARPAFGYWPALVPKSLVNSTNVIQSASEWLRG